MTEQNEEQTSGVTGRGYGGETNEGEQPPNRNRLLFTLREHLREMQQNVTGSQADIANIQKYVATLQAEISTLENASQSIDSVANDYKNAFEDLQDKAEELNSFANRKLDWVENNLTEDVTDSIDEIRDQDINAKIENARAAKERLEEKPELEPEGNSVRAAEIRYEQAQHELQVAQKAFDELAELQKRIEEDLKTAEGLRKSIEQEEDKDSPNIYHIYVLIKDLRDLLSGEEDEGISDKLNNYGKEELSTKLIVKWDALREALKERRDKENDLSSARSQLESEIKTLERLEKNRQQLIFEKIKGTVG